MADITHIGLQKALALYLKNRYATAPMVFSEVAVAGSYGDQGRLDVAAIWVAKAYTKTVVFGYEVKVSRSDLLADLRAGKYKKYLTQVDRLFFVFPTDVGTVYDVPPECGLIIYKPNGIPLFEQLRKAQPQARKEDPSLAWRLAARLYRENQNLHK